MNESTRSLCSWRRDAAGRASGPAGPAGHGSWERLASDGERPALLARPDAAAPTLRHVVLAQPAVARTASGAPRVSLTLMLDRQPLPDERDLRTHVSAATVGLDLTVLPDAAQLGDTLRPLFSEAIIFALQGADGPLLEASVTGGVATGALSGTVSREAAIALLDAVEGRDSGLRVTAAVRYRVGQAPVEPVTCRADLAAVHARLAQAVDDSRVLYERDLRNYLQAMVADGTVRVDAAGDPSSAAVAAAAADGFIRALLMILTGLDDDDRTEELGRRYALDPAPAGSMEITFRTRRDGEGAGSAVVHLEAPLEDVMRAALRNQAVDSVLHVFVEGGRGVVPLARRVRQARSRARPNTMSLAMTGNRLTTLATAIRPAATSAPSTHAVLAAHAAIRPEHLASVSAIATFGLGERPQSLPVVDDDDAPLWADRVKSDLFWYAPQFELAVPSVPVDPDGDLFRFELQRQGHDLQGRAGLEGEITLTLHQTMPAAASTAMERHEGAKARAVPLGGLSVALEIPYRDERGETGVQAVRATTVERNGNRVRARFGLRDDWVRLAYGALAYEGFQSITARLSVAFQFDAYRPLKQQIRYELLYGKKRIGLPVVPPGAPPERPDTPHVDAATGAIRFRGGEIRFAPDVRAPRARPRPGTVTAHVAQPLVATTVTPVVHPQLTASSAVLELLRPTTYAKGTCFRSRQADATLPCSTFGNLYVERTDDQLHAIGCQQAFTLGQTELRLYEAITVPGDVPGCRVLRSLQTPGRFLVVPDTYIIARYEPTVADSAYRPAVLLYSSIDVEDLSASRCVIMATLIPDLPRFVRERLLQHLRTAEHPAPQLEYPTELEAEVEVSWALPTGGNAGLLKLEAEATRVPHGFEASMATDAIGMPQLQAILVGSGIAGSAAFTLSDGTTLNTSLRLDLRRIGGPWEAGAVDAVINRGSQASLTNRTEAVANVSALLLIKNDAVVAEHPVGTRLEPGAGDIVALPDTPDRIVPVYTLESSASTLEEVRSFIEDISLNVVLLLRVDLAARGIRGLRLIAGLRGLAETRQVEFTGTSDPVQTIEFLLPLTAYLGHPALVLSATMTSNDGTTETRDAIEWSLGAQGYIVHLTEDLLGLTSA